MSPDSLTITVIIMAVAAVLITTAWRLRIRHRAPCLEDYGFYILFFYLMTFANQVLPTVAWGTAWYERAVVDRAFWILQALLGLPLALAALFFFVRFVFGLSGRVPPKKFALSFAAGSASFVALIAIYIFGFLRPEWIRATVSFFDAIRFLVLLGLIVFPLISAARARSLSGAGRARTVRGFAVVQAASLAVFEAAILAHPPELIHDILRSFFNIPPLIFLAVRISTIVPPILAEFGFDTDAAALFDRRGISPREREIVLLVCRGRTNREIEEALFISLDTVKRHLTHIFRKFGIRSRSELVALFLKPGLISEASKRDGKQPHSKGIETPTRNI